MTVQLKTYAEASGEQPYDWNAKLAAAKAGDISVQEYRLMRILAGNWPTCACGNQCSIIPRDENGEPIDQKLRDLGYLFSDLVGVEKWDEAIETLDKIEKRSAKLICKILKEKKREAANDASA